MTLDASQQMDALAGLRILEIGCGEAIGLAAVVLADFGADVVRIDARPTDLLQPEARFEPLLRRSKRLHCRHLAEWPASDLAEMIRGADAVLTQGEALWSAHVDLPRDLHVFGARVHCHVTGLESEFTAAPARENIVAAHVGRMQSFAALRDAAAGERPLYAALRVATHATAMSVVMGVVAALLRAVRTGAGAKLTTSLERGLQPYDMGASLLLQLTGQLPRPNRALPWLNYHPVQCRDGAWLQLGNLLPHLLGNFFAAAGLTADAPAAHPLEPLRWDAQTLEAFRDRMLTRMRERDCADWMRRFIANGSIVAHPYQTTQQALDDPDIVANGHVVDIVDHDVGATRQLGPLAFFSKTPALPRTSQTTDVLWPARDEAAASHTTELPLAGCTVVEFATIIAAPLGAALLSDLGARVIKVETPAGDPFRGMGGGFGAQRVNAGKESIALDLKAPAAAPIVRGLLERADIVIHNFRPGVPERLGIGYEQARACNPRLVYLSANGYGALGPGAQRPSTHPIPGAALGGALWQFGGLPTAEAVDMTVLRETARQLLVANEVNPDPNTAVVIAASALIGLWAARVHGIGQALQTDMFGANAWANWDDFLNYRDKPLRPMPDADLYGLHALHRLYECAQGWVFLQIETQSEWRRFCELSGHGLGDASADALQRTLAQRSADAWTQLLLADGIGCTRADGRLPGQWYAERASNMVAVERPSLGAFKRHGPQVDVAGVRPVLRPAPDRGANSVALARELGFTHEQIAALRDAGVLVG
jgi:crotonobetainyl-CoA:carnitine CoA-transferase CaiB-like acyl-CoA transferase